MQTLYTILFDVKTFLTKRKNIQNKHPKNQTNPQKINSFKSPSR